MTNVNKPSEIPQREHWAIIRARVIHHEASGQWAPGHGYEAYNESAIAYEAYLDYDTFAAAYARARSQGHDVRAIHVTGERFDIKTTVEVVKS